MRKRCLLAAAGCLLALVATAQERHAIEDGRRTGSHIAYQAVTGPIPFDKPYGELTAAQRAVFLANYESFPATDEPPYPLKGLGEVYAPMYTAHQKLGRPGELFAIAMVDQEGVVESVSVYKSPDDNLSRVATAVLFNTSFKPAKCAGKPCRMEFPLVLKLLVDY